MCLERGIMVKCRNKDLLASGGVKLGLLARMCRIKIMAICKYSPLKGIIHAKLIFHPLITHHFVDVESGEGKNFTHWIPTVAINSNRKRKKSAEPKSAK